jgi:hypothetical protein
MALEFKPYLDAAVKAHAPQEHIDTRELARYIVAVIEGSIMLARTFQDRRIIRRHFDHLKKHLREILDTKLQP